MVKLRRLGYSMPKESRKTAPSHSKKLFRRLKLLAPAVSLLAFFACATATQSTSAPKPGAGTGQTLQKPDADATEEESAVAPEVVPITKQMADFKTQLRVEYDYGIKIQLLEIVGKNPRESLSSIKDYLYDSNLDVQEIGLYLALKAAEKTDITNHLGLIERTEQLAFTSTAPVIIANSISVLYEAARKNPGRMLPLFVGYIDKAKASPDPQLLVQLFIHIISPLGVQMDLSRCWPLVEKIGTVVKTEKDGRTGMAAVFTLASAVKRNPAKIRAYMADLSRELAGMKNPDLEDINKRIYHLTESE